MCYFPIPVNYTHTSLLTTLIWYSFHPCLLRLTVATCVAFCFLLTMITLYVPPQLCYFLLPDHTNNIRFPPWMSYFPILLTTLALHVPSRLCLLSALITDSTNNVVNYIFLIGYVLLSTSCWLSSLDKQYWCSFLAVYILSTSNTTHTLIFLKKRTYDFLVKVVTELE